MPFEGMDFGLLNRGVPQIDVAGSLGKGFQLRDMVQAHQDDQAMRELSKTAGGNLGQLADLAQQKGLYRQAQALRAQAVEHQVKVADLGKKLAETAKIQGEVAVQRLGAVNAASQDLDKLALTAKTPEEWQAGLFENAQKHPIMGGLQQGPDGSPILPKAYQQYFDFTPANVEAARKGAMTYQAAHEWAFGKDMTTPEGIVNIKRGLDPSQPPVVTPITTNPLDAGTKIQQDRANELAKATTDAQREAINRFYDARIKKINEPGMAAMMMPSGGGHNTDLSAPLPDPGMEAIAQAIARGDQATQEYNIRNPYAKVINSRAAVIAGGDLIGKTGVEERKAGKVEFGPKGTAGKSLIALDTATGHLAHLQELGRALQNGDVQSINKASNYFQTQTGVPGANNFELVKNFVIPEIIKTAKGAGQITEAEEKQLSKLIGDMSSPEQIQGFVSQASHIMGSKIQAMNPVYRRYFGQEASVGDRLRPETRQLLQGIGVDLGGGKPPDKGKAPEIKFKDWWQPKPRGGEPDMSTRGKNPRFPQRNVAWVGAGAPDGAGWYAALGDGTVRRVE